MYLIKKPAPPELPPIPTVVAGQQSQLPMQLESQFPIGGNPNSVHRVIFIDFETTGLDTENDIAIEIGMAEAYVDVTTGEIYQVRRAYSALNDPGVPLDPVVKEVTGITDEELAGQSFDLEEIESFITLNGTHNPIMAAHNADYDEAFFNRLLPSLSDLPWVCTVNDMHWPEGEEPLSRKQEVILLQSGYRYNAHRALEDCLALVWMCYLYADIFKHALSLSKESRYEVFAVQFPFDCKDWLKRPDVNFRWDPTAKVWSKKVKGDSALVDTQEQLADLYDSAGASPELMVTKTLKTPVASPNLIRKGSA